MLCRTTHTSTRYASPLRNLSVVCINRMQPHPVFTNYQATRDGHVYNKKGRMLKGHKQNGYLVVGLPHNGCVRLHTVHLLVYEVFFGVEPRDRFHVDHINGIRDDNILENLQRLTHQQHARKTQTDNPGMQAKTATAKQRRVVRTSPEGTVKEFPSAKAAVEGTPGAHRSAICECAMGRRTVHVGFRWAYVDESNIAGEEWRELCNWLPGCWVSSLGRVKSSAKGKVLTLMEDNGYANVYVRKHVYVHRLVCHAFHGPAPSADHTVDHIDRNRSNNAPTNLRWATRKEQMANRGRFLTTGVL